VRYDQGPPFEFEVRAAGAGAGHFALDEALDRIVALIGSFLGKLALK
jgi:hypothetical protein